MTDVVERDDDILLRHHLDVDGICSIAEWGDHHVQPMFQIIHDDIRRDGPGRWFRQRWDAPPTEHELSEWVAGRLDW